MIAQNKSKTPKTDWHGLASIMHRQVSQKTRILTSARLPCSWKNIFSFLPDLFSPSSPSQLCRQDLPLAFTASILCLCSFATDHKSWFWLRRLTEVSPTEAEIAFAVAPRLDLVDTGPSTGGQDQPRPLFLCHHHHHHHYYHCPHHHHHHHHYML